MVSTGRFGRRPERPADQQRLLRHHVPAAGAAGTAEDRALADRLAGETRTDRARRLADRWNRRDRNRPPEAIPRIMSDRTWRRHRHRFAQMLAQWPGQPVLLFANETASPGWTRLVVLGLPDTLSFRERLEHLDSPRATEPACGLQQLVPDHPAYGQPEAAGPVGFTGAMRAEPRVEIVNLATTVRQFSSFPIVAEAGTVAGDAIWTLDLLWDLHHGRTQIGNLVGALDRDGNVTLTEAAQDAEDQPAPARRTRGRGPKPQPRLVRDAAEAEELAADWVRWLGWQRAQRTAATGDGGLDVAGGNRTGTSRVAGQVKFEALPTGRPVLQALYGAGHGDGADAWLFFSSAGYTRQAQAWADKVGMSLFRFTLDGAIEPVNEPATRLFRRT